MGVESLLDPYASLRKTVSDANDPSSLFRDATWDQVGKDKALTDFLHRSMDPDGSKYGGDTEALKTDLLNTTTQRGASMTQSLWDWVGARFGGENMQKKRFENLVGRLYESAPNRLFSGDASDTYQALKSGAIGAAIDLPLNIALAPERVAGWLGWKATQAAMASTGARLLGSEAAQDAIRTAAATGSREGLAEAADDIARQAASSGMKRSMLIEGAGNAVQGAVGDLAQQDANVQRGLQDNVSVAATGLNALGAGAIGAGIGAVMGRSAGNKLGRELTEGVPGREAGAPLEKADRVMNGDSMMARVGSAEKSISDDVAGEMGIGADAGKPAAATLDPYQAYNAGFKDLSSDLDEIINQSTAGRAQPPLPHEQLVAMRSAMDRLANPLDSAAAEEKLAASLREQGAAGNPDAIQQANAAELRAQSLRRFADLVTNNEMGIGELAQGDLLPQLRDALARFDPEVAAAMSPPSTRPAGAAANAATAATPPSEAAANTATAAPAPTAAAQPPVAPTAAGADAAPGAAPTVTQTVADSVPPPAGAPTAKEVESLAQTAFQPDEKAAFDDLSNMLSQANMDLDGVMTAISTVGQRQAIADLAKASGQQRSAVQSALTKVTAAVERERAKAATPEVPAAPVVATPEAGAAAAPAAAPAPAATTAAAAAPAAEKTAENTVAQTGQAGASVAQTAAADVRADAASAAADQALAQFSADTHQRLKTELGLIESKVGEVLDGIVSRISAKLDELKGANPGGDVKLTREEKVEIARQAIKDALEGNKELGIDGSAQLLGVLRELDPEKLVSAQGIEKAKVRVAQMTKDAVSFTYAKALGDLMPDPLNAADFEVLLKALPGIPAEDTAWITQSYRDMVGNALADRAARVGVDRVRREFGAAWDMYVAGSGGFQSYGGKTKLKVDFDGIVRAAAHGLEGDDIARIGAVLRDFRKQLEASGVPMDSQFANEALYIRAAQARDDLAKKVFETANAADYKKMQALRAMRAEDAAGTDVPRHIDGLVDDDLSAWSNQGSMVDNPIVERMLSGEGGLQYSLADKARMVTGRTQARNERGVRQLGRVQGALSDGHSDYLGYLWAQPRRLFTAAAAARRAIYGAAIDVASWARASIMHNGQKVTGTMKEVKGRIYENMQQRIEQQRFMSIADAMEKKQSGEMGLDAFNARMEEIGSISGRKVEDFEKVVAQRFLDSQERINSALEIQRSEVADILRTAKDMGESPQERVVAILQKVNEVVSKGEGDMVRAMQDYQTKAQKATEGRAMNRKGKAGGKEGSEVGAPDEVTNGIRLESVNGSDVLYHVARLSERDKDSLKLDVKGQGYEVVPSDALTLGELRQDTSGPLLKPRGDVLLFGRRIGSWIVAGDGASLVPQLHIDGLPAMNATDLTSVLKRGAFRKAFAKDFEQNANGGKMVKAAESASALPEGTTIPKEVSRTEEVRDAQRELTQSATPGSDDLDRTLGTFDLPPDRVIAFKRKSDGRITKAGLNGDATLRAALEKLGWDAADTEVGSLPAGRMKKSGAVAGGAQEWATANFVPMGHDTGTPNAAMVRKLAADADNAPTLLKAQRQPISMKDAAKIDMKNGRTLAQVVDEFDRTATALQWGEVSDLDSLNALVAKMQAMADQIESIAPHGIKRENASRRTSFYHLEAAMAGFTQEEKQAALDLLRRIDPERGGMPYFKAGDANSFAMGFGEDAGKSHVTVGSTRPDGMPMHFVVGHEVGHWAFANMLSPSERVQFLQSLAKYYGADGKLNVQSVIDSLSNVKQIESLTGKKVADIRANTNELFAWQFTNWLMDKAVGAASADAETSLWQRVLKYGQSLIQSFINSKVDPDLVPLFERIMPSRIGDMKYRYDALYDKSLGTLRNLADIGESERKAVTNVAGVMEKIDQLRGRIAQQLFTPGGLGDAGFAEDLKAAANQMFGLLYGNDVNSKTVYGLRAKLNPVRESGDWLRDANGKVVKRDGKGVRASEPVPGAVDPRELFSKSETGKLMQAIRDAAPEGADDATVSNLAFQAAADSEQFEMTLKASGIGDNPEVNAVFRQSLSQEFERQVKAGVKEEEALDRAEVFALKEAAEYGKSEFGLDINADLFDGTKFKLGDEAQRQALGSVARKLYDLMSDGLDHLQSEIDRFGFALRRADTGLVEEPKTAAEVSLDAKVEKKVAATSGNRSSARKPKAAPATEKSAEVVRGEERDRALDGRTDGVPTGASPLVKSLIARVPHRDPEQSDIIGTLMYRLIKHAVGDDTDVVTNADIAKMVGGTLEDGVKGEAMASQDTSVFNELRKGLRLASEDLTNGQKSPMGAIQYVMEVLARLRADDLIEEFGQGMPRQEFVQKMVKDAADVMRGKEPTHLPEMRSAIEDMLGDTADVLSGLAKSAPAKRAVGPEVVESVGKPISVRFTDGSYHPAFARADITARLSALSDNAARALLRTIGIESNDLAGDLSHNIAYAAPGNRKSLLASVDDAARIAFGDQATQDAVRKVDEALATARSRNDEEMVAKLMTQREALMDGHKNTDAVVPVLVNMANVFDAAGMNQAQIAAVFSRAAEFFAGSKPEVLAGLNKAAQAATTNPIAGFEALRSTVKDSNFRAMLKDAGFIGETDGTNITMFDQRSAKVVEKELEKIAKNENRAGAQVPDAPLAGEIVLQYGLEGEGARPDPLAIEQRSLLAGATEPVAKIMGKLFKRNRAADGLTEQEIKDVKTFRGLQLRENSSRIAKAGGQWLADMIKPDEGTGFYENFFAKLSADLAPMIDTLHKLSGKTNTVSRTIDGLYRNLALWTKEMPQSEAEQRIAMAMRTGSIAGLSMEEKRIAVQLQQHFEKMRIMQKDAGIPIGDVRDAESPFYLPQRFNVTWIAANREEAIDRLTKWMAKDGGGTAEQARERALKVIGEALNREEMRGFIDATSSTYVQAFGDKLQSRQLRIKGGDWEQMGPLFDHNLQSLVTSYTEAAHKRVEWVNRFGVKGHAANTYLDIADRGGVAAMDALMGDTQQMATGGGRWMPQGDDIAGGIDWSPGKLFSALARDENEAAQMVATISKALEQSKDEATRRGLRDWLEGEYAMRGGMGQEHFAKRAEAIVNGLADFGDNGRTVANGELDFMRKMIGVLGGRPAYTITANPTARSVAHGLKMFNSVTLLGTATLGSLPDMVMPLIRSGSMKAWLGGAANAVKMAMSDPATAAAMQRVGVGIESIINENLASTHGGVTGRISNAFFLANMLTQWTSAARQTAALVGYESIKANQAIVLRERMTGNYDSWSYRRAMRYLRQLGLAHLAEGEPLGTFANEVGDTRISAAIHRFVNESVFQPNRNDVPLWAQDPIAGIFYQFKSYPSMMGRLVKRQIGEAFATENGKYAGDPSGLMYLLTMGAAVGAGSSAAKDYLLGKNQEADLNGPSDAWHSVREHSFTNVAKELGWNDQELVKGDADKMIGWYAEGLLQLGAIGFLGDLMYQSAKSVDNGAFGRERIMSQIAGPSYGTFSDMIQLMEGAHHAMTSQEGDNNSKERAAVRVVAKRLPLIGAQQPQVESWVNAIAGEPTTPPVPKQ